MSARAPSGWYVICPDGSAWVAVKIDAGVCVESVEQANAETHLAANDRWAKVCRAIRDGRTNIEVPLQDADAIVGSYRDDWNAEQCTVEEILIN